MKNLYSHTNVYHGIVGRYFRAVHIGICCKHHEPSCYSSPVVHYHCCKLWDCTFSAYYSEQRPVHKVDTRVAISSTALLLIETGVSACCLEMYVCIFKWMGHYQRLLCGSWHWTRSMADSLVNMSSKYVTHWAETRHIAHFMKIEIRPEIGISMFNCPAVKNWKRSVAWFRSYGAKRIEDAERKFSRKRNILTLLQ